MRMALIAGATMAGMFLLVGCASVPTPFACTAIGYSSVAAIELVEPIGGVHLELCGGDGCTPGPVEMPVEVGSTATPIATGVFQMDGNSKTGWTATFLDAPTRMGFRVTQPDGTTIGEGYVEVDWERVDGTAQCGGNMAAEVRISL